MFSLEPKYVNPDDSKHNNVVVDTVRHFLVNRRKTVCFLKKKKQQHVYIRILKSHFKHIKM